MHPDTYTAAPPTTDHPRIIKLEVRGFVTQRRDGRWYAHIIDLCVDAEAPTREQALSKAREAAVGYLTWAAENGESLLRPSPWPFRLRYYLYRLRDRTKETFRRRPDRRRTFNQAVAA